MRDTEFSILVFVIGFWSRYIHRLLGALDILAGGTVSVSIMIHHVSCAALFERDTGRRYGVCCRFRTLFCTGMSLL